MPANDDSVMIVDNIQFYEAKMKDLNSWKQNNVYTEVKDTGQKCISTPWVWSLKSTTDSIIPKTRLVARGFEEI